MQSAGSPSAIGRLESRVNGLFPSFISCAVAGEFPSEPELIGPERDAVRGAVEERRREFAVGRACARKALQHLGARRVPIPMLPDRSPLWPHGYAGSITHCPNFCCAVAARSADARSIGIDVEELGAMNDQIADLVCSREEIAGLHRIAGPGFHPAILAWAMKEAFYKCYFPVTRTFLEFSDVSVYATGVENSGNFEVRLLDPQKPLAAGGHWFKGRWSVDCTRVYAGVTLSSEHPG